MAIVSHAELLALVSYDPATGLFYWKQPRHPCRANGLVGFKTSLGYLDTKIKGQTYKLHRLAWFYVHGSWPTDQIDHRNGERDDNRIANLREATHGQNQMNAGAHKSNRLGVRGVRRQRTQRYEARITVDHQCIYLGAFVTLAEAQAAREAAERKWHGEFARLSGSEPSWL